MTQLDPGLEPSEPSEATVEGRWLGRRRRAVIDGFAERSLDHVARARLDARSRRLPAVAVWLLAAVVHALTLVLLGSGAWLLVRGPWTLGILGGVLLLLGVLVAPKPSWGHRGVPRLTRADLPTLFAVLDAVAELNRAPVPDVVVVTADVNVAVGRLGRRTALCIGAPVWELLGAQARVAVLGHELGHLAHRDLVSDRWTGSAVDSVTDWQRFLVESQQTGSPITGLGVAVATAPLRLLCTGYLLAMFTLNAAASRRMEYLADLDAISAGGSAGALDLLDSVLAADAVEAALVRGAQRPDVERTRSDLRALMPGTDGPARQRRRVLAEQERSRLDDSHPRTSLRIELVARREQVSAGVVVDEATWAQVDAELGDALDEGLLHAARLRAYQW